ncbi:MAG: hypothetical protein EBX97_02475 [Actinobacteria bacterium]|jgi:DNA-binding MarR family transcriptional regulator|nr:hypothetical protein [Actinomycetota bacterium]
MGIARNATLTVTLTAKQVAILECLIQSARFASEDIWYDESAGEIYSVLRKAEQEQLGTNGI